MAHPSRFNADDPYLARLRHICLALPGAQEKVSHGHPHFFTKRGFAVFGAIVKGDHYSDLYARSVLVLPDDDELAALTGQDRFFVPAYYGPSGWIGYNLVGPDEPDWQLVAELVDMSYRNTAPRRLIAELGRV